MAMILNFRSRQDRFEQRFEPPESQAPQAPAEPAGAEIIIFPGVRRERHDAAPAETPKPRRQKARPKRDRLELPD